MKLLLLDGADITIGVSLYIKLKDFGGHYSYILNSLWNNSMKLFLCLSLSVCQANERDLDSNGMRMTKIAWLYYVNKYIELLDTVFFVMRKKWNQVTFLHVYHHAIMPIWAYNQVTHLH